MNKISYKEAMEKLEAIVSGLENDEVPVDELAEKVKEASKLIRICKSVLYETEEEVNKVLQEMQQEKPSED
jgi:exodeoxyribonuclease VII small subunit